MDLDYVNKQIVCPTCHRSEVIYIDLNEIRTDPKVASGVVQRSFIHGDHVLLLDLDHNGDIRTVEQLNQSKDVSIDHTKFSQIRGIMAKYESLVIFSKDPTFAHLVEQIIDEDLPESERFHFTNSELELKVVFHQKKIRLIRKLSAGIMFDLEEIDCCIIDSIDPILLNSEKFVTQLVKAGQLICLDETIHSALLHQYPELAIDLVS